MKVTYFLNIGRIDVHDGSTNGSEIGIPEIYSPVREAFGLWLANLETDEPWILEQILEAFESDTGETVESRTGKDGFNVRELFEDSEASTNLNAVDLERCEQKKGQE